MKRKETIREFINKRSSAAFVTFEFDTDTTSPGCFKKYSCISVEDFLFEYGRKSSYILDDYVVIDTKESCSSNDQGQTIWMTLQKKSDYVQTFKPIELNAFEVEAILNDLYAAKDLEEKAHNVSCIASFIDRAITKLEEKGE